MNLASSDETGDRPRATLHHTHLMASDIDATIGFWVDCFDGRVVADLDLAGVRNVLMEVGGGRLNLYAQPPNHRGVVNHLGVHVQDVPATVARLAEAGWEPRPVKEDNALSYAMVQGPDDLLIEVFRFDPETTEPELRPYFDLPPLPQEAPGQSGGRSEDEGPAYGDGLLSPQALSRLAQPAPQPLQMPDADDLSSVQRWRTEVHRGWLHGDPSPEQLGFEELVVGGVRCLAKNNGRDGATVIYVHGGGFCLGSPEVVLPITSRLAGSSEAEDAIRLVSVDYRLAPEHPYPAAVEDVAAVVRVNAEEQPGRPIVLVGDSAGANIALAVSVAATDVPLAGIVLLSPHVDLRGPDAASQNLDPRSDVDEDGSRWLTDAYRAGVAPEDPQISPLLADLRSLPPLLIQAGTRDNTMQAAVRLARRARRVGVPVTLDLWDGLWHTWHYHRELPEADAALLEVRRFIGERVAATINR